MTYQAASASSGAPTRLAEGYIDMDLNRRFIANRAATHLVPAFESGIDGILPGDLLIIDRSLPARNSPLVRRLPARAGR